MSKSYALPGLRLGWLCTQNQDMFEMMCHFKDYTTICAPAPSEILALMGIVFHIIIKDNVNRWF